VAGEYSIADMALIGWIKSYERQGIDIGEFPNVKNWIDRMLARPAVARAIEIRRDPPVDLSQNKEAQKILFGQRGS
jgi:GST-like protein